MEIKGKTFVSIYLTGWQMRMVKDFLGLDCHQWTVEVGGGPGIRYMGPGRPGLDKKAKRMYLEPWQREEIKDETGEECAFIELKNDINLKYKGPALEEIKERLAPG